MEHVHECTNFAKVNDRVQDPNCEVTEPTHDSVLGSGRSVLGKSSGVHVFESDDLISHCFL